MSNTDTNARSGKNPRAKKEAGDVQAQISEAAADIKERASEALNATSDVASDKVGQAAAVAQDALSGATDRLQAQAKEQQKTGAEFVGKLASNLRDAAHVFEKDIPFAARGIESAAEYVDDAAEKIRQGSLQDLVNGASDFARRQPAAFLGLTVLAGFAAVRFLKASGDGRSAKE